MASKSEVTQNKAMNSIGKLEEFDERRGDWTAYIERVEQYFLANDVDDEKKVPVLLTVIGGKTYSLLRTLTSPDKPSTKSFEEIVAILQGHLSPKPLLIAERFRFHKRDQREDENINTYVAEIKKLSEHCEFGTALNDSLRDRFVCGLHNESIQKRLLVETSLTFEKALKLAVAMETAMKDSVELRGKTKSEPPVNSIHEAPMQHRCYRCGKEGHEPQECYFKDQYCRNCGKKGHVKRVCRGKPIKQNSPAKPHSSKKKQQPRVHKVQNQSDSEDTFASLELHKVSKAHTNIIWVTPEVDGKPLQMELDTGSAVSVLPLSKYTTMFKSSKLHPTNTVLKTYTGEKIQPIGVLDVQVKYKEEMQKLSLYVVETKGPALFGRDWLEKITLDWKAINTLATTSLGNP